LNRNRRKFFTPLLSGENPATLWMSRSNSGIGRGIYFSRPPWLIAANKAKSRPFERLFYSQTKVNFLVFDGLANFRPQQPDVRETTVLVLQKGNPNAKN
jgi:hypothetical protein